MTELSPRFVTVLRQVVTAVFAAAVVVGLGTSIVAWITAGGSGLLSALLAAGVGVALALLTRFSVGVTIRNPQIQVAAMFGDYLFKILVVALMVLVAKNVDTINARAFGIALILSILAQAAVQAWMLMRASIPTIDQPLSKSRQSVEIEE